MNLKRANFKHLQIMFFSSIALICFLLSIYLLFYKTDYVNSLICFSIFVFFINEFAIKNINIILYKNTNYVIGSAAAAFALFVVIGTILSLIYSK